MAKLDEPSEDMKAAQREVQRLLGRCMLRLQQYEQLLKAMIVDFEIAGPVHDLAAIRADRKSRTERKTLGTLVGEFVGSFLVAGEPPEAPEPDQEEGDGPATFSVRFRIALTPDEHVQSMRDLRELVDLRNMLVHHFSDQHDLWTVEGCKRAEAALVAHDEQIKHCYGRLVEWAKVLDHARQEAAKAYQTETFRNLIIDGIMPDGTVDWPASSLVRGFLEAARALSGSEEEWVSVEEASRWIVAKYPDQAPERFGCKSWNHALQESKLFDLRHFQKNGCRVICFKRRANRKEADAPERTWVWNGTDTLAQPQNR